MDKCKYCHKDRDGYICGLDKNGHAFLEPIKSILRVKWYEYIKDININYCPMCGRKLKCEEHNKPKKIGYWITEHAIDYIQGDVYRCSCCGCYVNSKKNMCPDCEADMREGE